MPFNTELARQIAFEDIPRDDARYFEGRVKEIEAFNLSLNASARRLQSVFRIYQGAPGCGKTSLAHHLAETTPSAVFVKLSDEHLTDFPAVIRRIQSAARKQSGNQALNAVRWSAAFVERLTGKTLTKQIQDAADRIATHELRFALHIDEAHSLNGNALNVLKRMHVAGLGDVERMPCVLVLTGLAHTQEHINSHSGLTRAGDTTTINMTKMATQECADSTARMLIELNPDGGTSEARQSLANLAAQASFGWPRHLSSAQKAICEALLQTDGNALALDYRKINARCAELRSEYYEERMNDVPEYKNHPNAFKRVIVAIAARPLPRQPDHLAALCRDEINKDSLIEKTLPDAITMATAMDATGVVERKGEHWALAIPSMAAWAEQQLKRTHPSPTPEMTRWPAA